MADSLPEPTGAINRAALGPAAAINLLGQLRSRSRATLHIESDIAGTPVIVRDALHGQSGMTPLSREVGGAGCGWPRRIGEPSG